MNQHDLCKALNEYRIATQYSFSFGKNIFNEKILTYNMYNRGKLFQYTSEETFAKHLLNLPASEQILKAYAVCLMNYQLQHYGIKIERIATEKYAIILDDDGECINCKFEELEKHLTYIVENT
jgi:hypothetical protein